MKEFWNSRYQEKEYAYGLEPNLFFESELVKLKPGKALFPAEGEGRNAVFAAKSGWEVTAFDLSEEGKNKALLLADRNQIQLDYQVASLEEFDVQMESFDLLVLIFAHFPSPLRRSYHQKLASFLKPGGVLILESFSKKHIEFNSVNEKAGGPKDPALLFSKEELQEDFSDFSIRILEETVTELDEGLYHVGKSAVVRMVAVKKKKGLQGFSN